jgi:hypothetical protein
MCRSAVATMASVRGHVYWSTGENEQKNQVNVQ